MRYIRFFLSALLVFCVSGLPVWGKLPESPELNKEIEWQVTRAKSKGKKTPVKTNAKAKAKAARPAAKQNSATLTERQKIVKALDKVRLKKEDPNFRKHFITTNAFIAKNRESVRKAEKLLHQMKYANNELGFQLSDAPYTKEYGYPNYEKVIEGFPFIYLTDVTSHGTVSVLLEVMQVLNTVREANPKARVLLALEFAEMTDFDTPIFFAKKEGKNMDFLSFWEKIARENKNMQFLPDPALAYWANQLNMDVLALDDFIYWKEGNTLVYKIGDYLINEPLERNISFEQQVEDLRALSGMSPWGVELRNAQWVKYLKAVEPFYDIIIVYAGNGHIESESMPTLNVPNQLEKDHLVVNFYSAEINDTDMQYFLETYQKLRDADLWIKVPEQNYGQDESAVQWDGRRFMYMQQDSQDIEKYVHTLYWPSQYNIQEVRKYTEKLGLDNKRNWRSVDVYIP